MLNKQEVVLRTAVGWYASTVIVEMETRRASELNDKMLVLLADATNGVPDNKEISKTYLEMQFVADALEGARTDCRRAEQAHWEAVTAYAKV